MGDESDARNGRTGSDVVPVRVVRSQFLVGTGLHGVNPVGDLHANIEHTPTNTEKQYYSPRAYRIASSDRRKR